MAASVDAAPPPPAVAPEEAGGGAAEQARTLIGALNLLSRNLPLPPAVLQAVSSIYHDGGAGEGEGEKEGDDDELVVRDGGGEGGEGESADAGGAAEGSTLIQELEDAMFKNQRAHMSYSELTALKEGRFNTSIQHRLAELEGFWPS